MTDARFDTLLRWADRGFSLLAGAALAGVLVALV